MTARRSVVRRLGLRAVVPTAVALLALAASASLLPGTPTAVAQAAAPSAPGTCEDLTGTAVPARVMSLPTSGGRVTAAATTTAVVSGQVVTYCKVDAAIRPVDPAAPDIRMRLALPAQWNGRSMMLGGGGLNGTIPDVTATVPFGRADLSSPLARGFAVVASDSGHQADPLFVPSPSLDGSFATNDEALRNFAAGDALKKTHDAALFLVRAHYGKRSSHDYFAGGSTGGREALTVAQRWPRAFDGVVSVYPAWNNATELLYLGHLSRVLSRPGAFPGPAQQQLLHRSVVAACDARDGLTDGVVSDERGCRFDPATLQCPDAIGAAPTCLSRAQVASVREMSRPWRLPYRLASGERGYPGFPFLSGASMATPLLGFGTSAPANPMPKDTGYGPQLWEQWTRYFLTRGPGQDSLAIDPARPGRWKQRVQELSLLQDRNDADLRPFRRAGGKLLLLHGTADELVSHRSTADYVQRVRSIVGRDLTRDFLRYYEAPGANHANITPAFAAQWDSIDAITTWAEQGRAPRDPVVRDGTTGRTRPLCEFPTWPRYRGGDPDAASSFACTRRVAGRG